MQFIYESMNANVGNFWHVFCNFRPLTGNKTSLNYFFLVEEVLSFNLVGHMWKSVRNCLQEWVFNIVKWKWGRSRWNEYFENYLQKWFVENLVGKTYRKFLWENLVGNLVGNLAGNSCGKILRENVVGNSCRKFLWEILVGKSCGKILRENLAGKSCGKSCRKILWENLARNLAGKSCGKFLRENLVGKSCGKLLQENLAGNLVWKSFWKFLQEMLWEIPHTYLQTISEGNF